MFDLFLIAQSQPQVEVSNESLSTLSPPLQIALLLGALSFATAALISLTAFTRIIIVLSFVRRALSTNEIPPNQVVLGLAFFLTLFVMAPTMERINERGVKPYLEAQNSKSPEQIEAFGVLQLVEVVSEEIRGFITVHTREDDLALFLDLANIDPPASPSELSSIPLKVLIPAFIISELKTAFIMGFCIYIPFLLIDLVISTVLMSLGMMMMPPVVVSTPCKLLLFVLVDGWQLISKALVSSFATPP